MGAKMGKPKGQKVDSLLATEMGEKTAKSLGCIAGLSLINRSLFKHHPDTNTHLSAGDAIATKGGI